MAKQTVRQAVRGIHKDKAAVAALRSDPNTEVKLALDVLVRICNKHGVNCAGFVFCADPHVLWNFGNVPEADTLELYESMVALCDKKRAAGLVKSLKLDGVQ